MKRCNLIVTTGQAAAVENGIAQAVGQQAGDSLTVPLSATGAAPATHMGTSWGGMAQADYDQLVTLCDGPPSRAAGDGDAEDFWTFAAGLGLQLVYVAPG